ncbi:type II toxin-antitoxin system VapC family toxin [Candidatus Woesearchaeota archaeon]|nr:type II toxin-antitoxin system VapC family toxin [Candidatus Woesearchaeota archaeon]
MNEMNAYLDANVFIYACTSEDAIGTECQLILDALARGKLKAVTSSLTFDELLYKLARLKGMDAAILFTENFLSMPNLLLADVNESLVIRALQLVKNRNLLPRDAIHAATAEVHQADALVSDDKDFAGIRAPKWLSIAEFAKTPLLK